MDFEILKNKLKNMDKKIVFPEGDDLRILRASSRIAKEGIANCILLGNREVIEKGCA